MSYLVAFEVGWRTHVVAFPLLATVLNVSWELVFGLLFPPESRASRAMYRLWLLLDLGLLWQAFRWGAQEFSVPLALDFAPLLAFALCAAVGLQVAVHRWLAQPRLQAYFVNLIMSLSFLELIWARPDHEGLSIWVATLKLLGTTCISLANVATILPEWRLHRRTLALFASILVCDLAYLLLLARPFG